MIRVDIPGSGMLEIEHFVCDFSGTLSEDGFMLPGLKDKLNELSRKLRIHVLTSDTFGRAREELAGVSCQVHVLEGEGHTEQKENYVKNLGADHVVAFGNGNNDERMLRAVKIGIAVCLKEGCSRKAFYAAMIFVMSPVDAIDLLLNPKRLIATLRV
ncbi:MAG: HAD hydrolase family protein [Nitrospirota bacterium]